MTGIQAAGSAPIAQAIKAGKDTITPVDNPETVATAIRIGAPVSWKKAVNAIYESKGTAETVTDEEILEAQKTLARVEGIFVEPASASSIAGLKKAHPKRRNRQRRAGSLHHHRTRIKRPRHRNKTMRKTSRSGRRNLGNRGSVRVKEA